MDGPAMPIEPAVPAVVRTMSQRYWDLDWALPWAFEDVGVDASSFEDVAPFFREHGADALGSDPLGRWRADPMTPAKRAFLRECDVFVFRQRDETVGFMLGHPTDWSTWYCRSMAVLPKCRGGLLGFVTDRLADALRGVGVTRIETETAGNNPATRIGLPRYGWVNTGMTNTDRWGALFRLTKYLDDGADEVFRRQYCFDGRPRGGR